MAAPNIAPEPGSQSQHTRDRHRGDGDQVVLFLEFMSTGDRDRLTAALDRFVGMAAGRT